MVWCVINVALLCKLDHAENNFSIFRLLKVDILSNNWVDKIVVGIALFHELRCQYFLKGRANLKKLLYIELGCGVDDRSERLVHVLGSSMKKMR